MTEFTPFEQELSFHVIQLQNRGEDISVDNLLTIYHLRYSYSPKEYHLQYIKIYNALLNIQYKAWDLWHTYTLTQEFAKVRMQKEFYSDTDAFWKDDHFKELFDSGILTKRQVEESLYEAMVWEDWVIRLKENGIPFLISGRGNKFYHIPGFYDYSIYKFNNFKQTSKQFIKQSRGFTENGFLLPERITKNLLSDTVNHVQGLLEDQEIS